MISVDALTLPDAPVLRATIIVVASFAAAAVTALILRTTLVALARRSRSLVDDEVVAALQRPVFLSIILVGLALAAGELVLSDASLRLVRSVLATLAVVIWTGAIFRIGAVVLGALGSGASGVSLVQPRTMPVFDMMLKVVVVGAAIYFVFLAWRVDLTAWLASAGIIGIAIGFAAKDTLANLFSGIFIVADAPYKIGDFIVLDGGLRGRVTKIGLRSTRVLTRDDIEVTVPNSVIGSSKIVNETGGPDTRQRVRVAVDCAYGSDIDVVQRLLLGCAVGARDVAAEPPPQVRFTDFGGSGLRFELRVWILDPAIRGQVLHDLRCRIYRAFQEGHIEIPYSKHDVYIKQVPPADARA